MKRVLVEVRLSSDDAIARSLTTDELQLPGFTLDASYEPVPITPPKSIARSVEAADEEVVLIRGEVDEDQEKALREAPNVVGVWTDARIEPFSESTSSVPLTHEETDFTMELFQQSPDSAFPAFDLGTASPCGTTDCHPEVAKGTIQEVAKYLGCDRLWGKGVRGQGITIGVCDSGVSTTKVPSVIGGWSPTPNYQPGNAPATSHGTMCAYDVIGMCPDAKILDIAILQSSGSMSGFLSDAISAFQWAMNQYKTNGAPQILTNSWGMFQKSWAPDYATKKNHPFTRKVVEAIDAGMIVLFAAGNCGSQCPSGKCGTDTGPGKSIWGANGHPAVITVGAANILEQWIGYTSQGPAALSPKKPDFCAPSHFKGARSSDTGTSAATPICAGVIGLLKSQDSALTQAKAKEALQKTAKDICSAGWDANSGFGMIQAYNAYRYLFEPSDSLVHAMWTHGSNVEVEYVGQLATMRRMGNCAGFIGKAGTNNWFHFAVPTPVIVKGKRLKLDSVIVMFQTDPDVKITSLHIYDGHERIQAYDGLSLSGPHLFERFDVNNRYVRFGIGVSVGVHFGKDATSRHLVLFVAAGADFVG